MIGTPEWIGIPLKSQKQKRCPCNNVLNQRLFETMQEPLKRLQTAWTKTIGLPSQSLNKRIERPIKRLYKAFKTG